MYHFVFSRTIFNAVSQIWCWSIIYFQMYEVMLWLWKSRSWYFDRLRCFEHPRIKKGDFLECYLCIYVYMDLCHVSFSMVVWILFMFGICLPSIGHYPVSMTILGPRTGVLKAIPSEQNVNSLWSSHNEFDCILTDHLRNCTGGIFRKQWYTF